MTVKGASLSGLQGADGSSTCECNGYTVIGSVNGPIEVQRRDALPEEAAIEVNVRPAVGVGSMIALLITRMLTHISRSN